MPVPRNNDVGINLKANAQGLDLAIAKLRELNALLQSAGHGPASWMPGPLFGVPPTQAVKGLMAGQFRPSQYGAIGGAQLEQLTKQVGGWAQEAAISYGLLQAQVVEPAMAPRQQAAIAAGAPMLPPPFYGGYYQSFIPPPGVSQPLYGPAGPYPPHLGLPALPPPGYSFYASAQSGMRPPPASPGMLALPGLGQSSYTQMRYGYNPAVYPGWVEGGIPGRGGGPPALPPRTVSSAGGRPSDGDARTVLARIQEEEDAKKAVPDPKSKGRYSNHMLYGLLFQAFFGILFGGLQEYVQSHVSGQRMPQGAMIPAGLNLAGLAIGAGIGTLFGNPFMGAMAGGMTGQLGGQLISAQLEGRYRAEASVRQLTGLYSRDSWSMGWSVPEGATALVGYGAQAGLDPGRWWAPNWGTGARMGRLGSILGGPLRMFHGGSRNGVSLNWDIANVMSYATDVQTYYGDESEAAAGRIAGYLSNPLTAYAFMPRRGLRTGGFILGQDSRLLPTLTDTGLAGVIGALNRGGRSRFDMSTAVGMLVGGGDRGPQVLQDYLTMNRDRGGQTEALMALTSQIWQTQAIGKLATISGSALTATGEAEAARAQMLMNPAGYLQALRTGRTGIQSMLATTNAEASLIRPYASDPNVLLRLRTLEAQASQLRMAGTQSVLAGAQVPFSAESAHDLIVLQSDMDTMSKVVGGRPGAMRSNLRRQMGVFASQWSQLEQQMNEQMAHASEQDRPALRNEFVQRFAGLRSRWASAQGELESGWMDRLVSATWGVPGRLTGIMSTFNYAGAAGALERGGGRNRVFGTWGAVDTMGGPPPLPGSSDLSTGRGGILSEAVGSPNITINISGGTHITEQQRSQLMKDATKLAQNYSSSDVGNAA
jgi:hypothetical protein